MFIRTVLGDKHPETLGFTHCHDHLFVFQADYTVLPERICLDSYKKTKEEVQRFREKGGRCMVDVQPFGAGRHPEYLKKLSAQTGINIIASTGLHKSSFYRPNFWSSEAFFYEIADLFISEVENGMYEFHPKDPFHKRGEVRAGVIKIATGEEGITLYYQKVFDAAVVAHEKTGAPIITHAETCSVGIEQAEYLLKSGVEPESIIISHMDRVVDINKNLELAKLGVFMEYDTLGRFKYHSNEDEIVLVNNLLEKGFGAQITLGMDSTRERFLSYGGSLGLNYILTAFIPELRKFGVSDQHIEMMTVDNPKRALVFKEPVHEY